MQTVSWDRLEAVLHRVQKPGRYVGGEYNSTTTPWEDADMHVCLAFPDVYDLGMSNYALMILYDILNQMPGTLAHRTYLPAPDMLAQMRGAAIPLYGLEGYMPVAAYDVLAISTAYEQLYTNCLELLDLAGLPVRSTARDTSHPLVIGGGHGTFNPEPVTDFFDAFVIGEAEDVLPEIVASQRALRKAGRPTQLRALAQLDGVYVPGLYRAVYAVDGSFLRTEPLSPDVPASITKRVVGVLPPSPIRQLVPNIETVHNRAVVEIQRGCTRGCRFCQAGIITRPVRERPAGETVATARDIIDNTGYEEIALLSLSSADHTEIQPLLQGLLDTFEGRHLSISLPSLRIESFSVNLAEMLSKGRRSGFTFAPEAGSDKLRRTINKDIATEDLLAVAEDVFTRGWRTLKLYFMIGLPGETDDDIDAIIDLARQVRGIGMRIGGRKTEVHVSVSTFVPKPHTVFQWEALADEATITERQERLKRGIRGRGFSLSWNPYFGTWLEAILARGDRRMNAVVERAWQLGARFDAWDEWQDMDAWDAAFAEHNPGHGTWSANYLHRIRDFDESLPWDHLGSGVTKRWLAQDAQSSRESELLSDCREDCHACGILRTYRQLQSEEWKCPVLS